MPYPHPKTSFNPLESMVMESVAAQALMESVRMGLFDFMAQGPRTAADLAQELGFKPDPLEALLDLLVSRGILESHGQAYANTPMANDFLVSTSPLYQDKALETQVEFNSMIQDGIQALLRGEEARRAHTDGEWSEPDIMTGTLQHAVSGQLQDAVDAIRGLPEFKSFRAMADIGGNHGQYSMELVDRNPGLTSTILDLAHVVEAARERCKAEGYGDRIQCRPFDLREDELDLEAYDLVFTSHVLYASGENLEEVLVKVRDGLKPGGCFASHHFTVTHGADHYCTAVEFITRLSGYATHFLDKKKLEAAMTRAGFSNLTHAFTGPDKRSLLVVGRKTP